MYVRVRVCVHVKCKFHPTSCNSDVKTKHIPDVNSSMASSVSWSKSCSTGVSAGDSASVSIESDFLCLDDDEDDEFSSDSSSALLPAEPQSHTVLTHSCVTLAYIRFCYCRYKNYIKNKTDE